MTTQTFAEFHREIREEEGDLAPGSETAVYGHFVERMHELGGRGWRESDVTIDPGEVAWWRRAYQLFKTCGDEDDVQDVFDRV